MDGLLSQSELRERVEALCAIDRTSASDGERRSAELLAAELRELGASVRIEAEQVHGTYWQPIGLLTGAAALAGLAAPAPLAVAVGAACAALAADDVRCEAQLFRRLLRSRTTHTVVAELGEPTAPLTVLLSAHHDAARSGLVFHPELPRAVFRRWPQLLEHLDTGAPTMWGAVGGPALVAAGALVGSRAIRTAGTLLSAGYVAAMVDIAARETVPGANDNASAVGALLSVARSFAAAPVEGVRLVCVCPGSEESFQEGMSRFAARHFDTLPRTTTYAINLESVGSPQLFAMEGEGMLGMNEYPKDFIALAKQCAAELGIELVPRLRTRNASDGLIPLKAGYATMTLCSVDEFKAPTHYHWPTDVPDNVHFETVAQGAALARRVVERLGEAAVAGRPPLPLLPG